VAFSKVFSTVRSQALHESGAGAFEAHYGRLHLLQSIALGRTIAHERGSRSAPSIPAFFFAAEIL
jgi:hypothetical protein